MAKKFVILDVSEVNEIDFDKVMETSSKYLRWNNDKTKTFVKYEGGKPSFLYGKETLTLEEMKTILNNPLGEWYSEE